MLRTLLIVVLTLGLAAGLAVAKPKVAMTPIEGDTSGSLGEAIIEALDGSDIDLIAPKAVTRGMDKLGYEGELTEKQAKKLAKELEVDAVVTATYDREGKRKVLKFSLVVGGKKARGFKVVFNNENNRRVKEAMRDKLVESVTAGSEPAVAEAEEEEEEDAEVKPKKKDKKVAAKSKKKKKKKKLGDDEEEDEEEEGDDEETDPSDEEEEDIEAAVRRVNPHTANRVAVRMDVGVSVQNRNLTFTQRSNFPEGPKPYTNAPVPGARFEAELFPFAFSNPKSLAAGLGFAGEFDQTLSLNLRTSAEPNQPVKATQLHWGVGLRFRIPFGKTAMSPTLTLGAGIARRRFNTDKSVLMDPTDLDVPDTYYQAFDPGLSFRIPLAKVVALTFGGKALVIYDAGAIQNPESYGQAKVFGGQAEAGLDIVLGDRFAIRLVGEFTQVGFAFTGTGQLARARDRDPDTKDIGGAADRSIGGAATLAVLY